MTAKPSTASAPSSPITGAARMKAVMEQTEAPGLIHRGDLTLLFDPVIRRRDTDRSLDKTRKEFPICYSRDRFSATLAGIPGYAGLSPRTRRSRSPCLRDHALERGDCGWAGRFGPGAARAAGA